MDVLFCFVKYFFSDFHGIDLPALVGALMLPILPKLLYSTLF